MRRLAESLALFCAAASADAFGCGPGPQLRVADKAVCATHDYPAQHYPAKPVGACSDGALGGHCTGGVAGAKCYEIFPSSPGGQCSSGDVAGNLAAGCSDGHCDGFKWEWGNGIAFILAFIGVKLVLHEATNTPYALKCMRKGQIIALKQALQAGRSD